MGTTFTKAQRKRIWLKLAVAGPSGSGKTMSALRLAFGFTDSVALIDTENGSASLYADYKNDKISIPAFDVLEVRAPYTVPRYTEAIRAAVEAGYQMLLIDSITHEWAGDGGLLAQKEILDSRGGNGFANWAKITKEHEAFKTALLESPIHIICTMRSKEEYAQMVDERGKTQIKKLGLADVQREGMNYEFTIKWNVDIHHIANTDKDRTGLFTDAYAQITEAHGKQLRRWLESGAELASGPIATDTAMSDEERKAVQIGQLRADMDRLPRQNQREVVRQMLKLWQVNDPKKLGLDQLEELDKIMEAQCQSVADAAYGSKTTDADQSEPSAATAPEAPVAGQVYCHDCAIKGNQTPLSEARVELCAKAGEPPTCNTCQASRQRLAVLAQSI